MDITLKSEKLEVAKILKKTKAEMFIDLKVGDVIILSIPVRYAGGNKGTYASYIKIENLGSEKYTCKSFNQISSALNCFEFRTLL